MLSDAYDVVLYDFLARGNRPGRRPTYSNQTREFAPLPAPLIRRTRLRPQAAGVAPSWDPPYSTAFIRRLLDFAQDVPGAAAHDDPSPASWRATRSCSQMLRTSPALLPGSEEAFALYTHYMYERSSARTSPRDPPGRQMRRCAQRFLRPLRRCAHCADPADRGAGPVLRRARGQPAGYRAIATPTLTIVGGQDRAIPLWQQRKIFELLPNTRWRRSRAAATSSTSRSRSQFFG